MYIIVNNTPLGKIRDLFLLWWGYLFKKIAVESKMRNFENRLSNTVSCKLCATTKLLGVPPQSIGCAATRYQICRHNVSGVLPQVIRCASTKYRVCLHKVSGVLPQGTKCAATMYRVCCHKVSGVPPQCIGCTATVCQVCLHKSSGVLPQGTKRAATMYRVCCHKVSGVPPQCIGCAANSYQVCLHNASSMLPHCIRCVANFVRNCVLARYSYKKQLTYLLTYLFNEETLLPRLCLVFLRMYWILLSSSNRRLSFRGSFPQSCARNCTVNTSLSCFTWNYGGFHIENY
jgi:hypothetical protein